MNREAVFTAFAGSSLLVSGGLERVVRGVKSYVNGRSTAELLIFDDSSGEQVDFDLRGTVEEVVHRIVAPAAKKGPGRPRLGVVGREISLLPRHWEWLDHQPQSASATIRRLIDSARKNDPFGGDSRRRIEAAGRFIWAIAGNYEHFEEASRALYARNWPRLRELTTSWPRDVRDHLFLLLEGIETTAAG